ncbi:MAG TPA: MnhB domain-containing protein, partial [Aggregatilineales bacterium]|nr:MnhB domain-containing protein [Aggregatilineales bacterium]
IGISVALFALVAISDREARIEELSQVPVSDGITRPITQWHLENSYPETTSTDVVGAIVVDFRGTDTIIEITVFSVAALGLLTLLTLPVGREVLFGDDLDDVLKEVAEDRSLDEDEEIDLDAIGEKPTTDYYRMVTDRYRFENFSTPLTRAVAQIVFPLALLLSLSQILYGGGAPGDGFTGGMVSGLAVASWY